MPHPNQQSSSRPKVERDPVTGRFTQIEGRLNKKERMKNDAARVGLVASILIAGIISLGWYACVSGFFWFLLFLLPFCLGYSLYVSFKYLDGPRGFVGVGAFVGFFSFLYFAVSFFAIILVGQSCPIPTG
jgi:hypothetical protein